MNTSDTTTVQKPPARERILLTAHDLFYQNGIRATGIDRVIADSSVTKATFYRHFPSKNHLICAFLEYRHQRWMDWFIDALARHGGGVDSLLPAFDEWFRDKRFRGCAFINSVGELGGELPEVMEISRRHKQDVAYLISTMLAPSPHHETIAQALVVALDGATVRAQLDPSPDVALNALGRIFDALCPPQQPNWRYRCRGSGLST